MLKATTPVAPSSVKQTNLTFIAIMRCLRCREKPSRPLPIEV